jgi:hypothetical protein
VGQPSDAEQAQDHGRDAREQAALPPGYRPTRVVYYTWGRERGAPLRPLAEFRWSAEEGVTATVFDHDCASTVRRLLKQGANLDSERRMVTPEEGPVFMRALLGHGNSSSYYWFLDKTP